MGKNISSKELLGYFTLTLWIVWRPFSLWVLHFDTAGRIPLMFLGLYLITNYREVIRYAKIKPLCFLSFSCIWSFINGYMKDSYVLKTSVEPFPLVSHILIPLLICLIATISFNSNFNRTLKVISRSLVFYAFLAIVFNRSMGGDERMSLQSININEIVLYCVVGVGLMFVRYVNGTLKRMELCTTIFPMIVCVMAGSRMGLLSFFIICLALLVSKVDMSKPKNIIPLLLGLIIVYFSIDYILHNSFAGERILGTQDEMNDRYADLKTGTVLDLLGDRGLMYFYSWPYFIENPITGIGIYNYIPNNVFGMRLHTEYATQYVENGLLGFIPFVLFLSALTKKMHSIRKSVVGQTNYSSATMIMGLLISVLFSNMVLWSFDMYCVFCVYALVYVYIKNNEYSLG